MRGREILREVVIGGGLGFVFLGVGARLAMRANALAIGQAPILDSGGTLTVLACGVAAGMAGALLHALARAVVSRTARGAGVSSPSAEAQRDAGRLLLFAALLAIVTARGLRGSAGPTWQFWLLVVAYGFMFQHLLTRRRRHRGTVHHVTGDGWGGAQP